METIWTKIQFCMKKQKKETIPVKKLRWCWTGDFSILYMFIELPWEGKHFKKKRRRILAVFYTLSKNCISC